VDESRKTKYFYSMRDFETYNKTKKPSNVRYLKGLGSLSRPDWEHVFGEMRLFRLAEDSRSDKMMEMAFGTNSALRKKWLQS
jgi:DNA gyrase/topoisomerase IV subunit B